MPSDPQARPAFLNLQSHILPHYSPLLATGGSCALSTLGTPLVEFVLFYMGGGASFCDLSWKHCSLFLSYSLATFCGFFHGTTHNYALIIKYLFLKTNGRPEKKKTWKKLKEDCREKFGEVFYYSTFLLE